MTASSTSSSDAPRSRSRHRRALLAAAVTAVAALAATAPINAELEVREFATSAFGRAAGAAVGAAGDRPLVAVVGTSQTQSAVDARTIEESLAPDGAPVVFDVCTGGLHASVFPALVRRLMQVPKPDLVLLELGHISHDQYGGAWTVRNFVRDESVLREFEGTPRGRKLLDTVRDERRFPWLATPRLLRVVLDSSTRESARGLEERLAATRGFHAYRKPKDFDQVVATLERDPTYASPDLVDSCPQNVFTEAARVCAEIARARGCRFAVFLHPVNRPVAARVKVLRHFEQTSRTTTIPALRASGIEVLVPPDRFFEPDLYYDHVHFHEQGAAEFTRWIGAEIARIRSSR